MYSTLYRYWYWASLQTAPMQRFTPLKAITATRRFQPLLLRQTLYRHTYSGFDIYSANLWWDKADKSVDDYIVAQITLNSPHYTTRRGIHVGSAADEIEQLYGPTKKERSEGKEWLSYALAKRVISVELVNNKVASVIMTYDNGQ